MELISVIIPCYNAEKTVEATVKSVIEQTYENTEIILVDDCSTDNTFSVLKELKKIDKRIHVYQNEKNAGVSFTRNKAIAVSKGTYIALIDSDDRWEPEKLEKQMKLIEETGAALCYTAMRITDENGTILTAHKKVPKQTDYKAMLKRNEVPCSSVVVRKDILKPFTTKFFHEDYIQWLNIAKQGWKMCGIDQPLLIYRTGGRNDNKKNAARNRWMVYRKSEGFGVLKSLYYFSFYAWNGIIH